MFYSGFILVLFSHINIRVFLPRALKGFKHSPLFDLSSWINQKRVWGILWLQKVGRKGLWESKNFQGGGGDS